MRSDADSKLTNPCASRIGRRKVERRRVSRDIAEQMRFGDKVTSSDVVREPDTTKQSVTIAEVNRLGTRLSEAVRVERFPGPFQFSRRGCDRTAFDLCLTGMIREPTPDILCAPRRLMAGHGTFDPS